jgi:hypothetical protein
MHNDLHHDMKHSAHELMTTGHKAVEELVQKRVEKLIEEKHSKKLDEIAEHIAEGVGTHLSELSLK